MKLDKKKNLTARTLGVGKGRIVFVKERLNEIKEAITKQDIHDLKKDGAIIIKEIKGRSKVIKRKRQRNDGKVRRKVNVRKKNYIIMTRKLRSYLKHLKAGGEISREDFIDLRKKIRNKHFDSLRSMKEFMKSKGGKR
ncbi:hypothetical protein COU57_04290 [Candidatus Pacearchaeota archaeon CG10_big_fil_rev_8_21_14_0_10_32_14]|nr:MAG: hypothetical protein COU57_04290 [Candidatus Pacearchaeota archaeon CG10_big_fil_rev_8_21_14_0_10_32_14]